MPRDIGGFPVPNSIVACLGEKRAADIFAFNDFLDEKFDLSRFRFNLLEEFMKILDLKVTYPIFKKYFSSEQGRELQDGEVIRLLCSQGQNNLAEDITCKFFGFYSILRTIFVQFYFIESIDVLGLKRVFTPKGNQSYVTPSHLVRKKEPVSGKVGSTDETSTSAKASPKPTTSSRKPAKSTQSLIPEKKNLSLILSERRSNPDRKCKPAKSTQSLIPEKKNLSLILSERRSNPDRKVKLISPHQKTEKDKLPVGSSKSKDKVVPSRTRRKDLEMQKKLQITSAEFVDGDSSDEDIIPSTQATGAQSPAIHETPNVQKKFVKAKMGNSSDNKDSETLDDELAKVKKEKSPSSQRDGCKQLKPADLNKISDPRNSSDKNERTKAADSSDESKSSDSDGDLRASNAPDEVPSRTTNERLSPTKTSPIKPNSIKNVPADSSDESKSSDSDGDLGASNAPDKVPSRTTIERLSPTKISPIKPNSIKNNPKPPRPRNHSISDDSDSGESDDGCRGITQNAQDVTALACSPKPAGKRPSCVLGELDDPPGEENGSQIVGSRKRKASDTSIQLPKSKEPKMSFPAADDAKKMSGTSDSESDSDESDSAHREAPTKLPEANCSVGSKIETNADTPIGEMAASTKKVHPFDSTRLPGDLDASFPGNDISVIRQCSTPPTAVSKGSKNAKTKQPLTPVNQRSILEFAKPTPPTRVPADDEYAEMKDHYIRLGFTDLNDDFDFESNLATFAEELLDDDSEVYLLQCPEEIPLQLHCLFLLSRSQNKTFLRRKRRKKMFHLMMTRIKNRQLSKKLRQSIRNWKKLLKRKRRRRNTRKRSKKVVFLVRHYIYIDAVNSHKTPSADIRDDKEQLLIDRVFSNLEPESEEVPSKKKKKKKHQEVVPDGELSIRLLIDGA
ncbi:unnamed protein product [Nesidiocoris tenuis]|uniref:Uncharacterized protein n=1 Tax=Nesidiocoris tenuis TaxID=355587 RepID=A0A6H5GB17_9HEMI|nr:unnamed protein product [Nesidiocoris tenuis]